MTDPTYQLVDGDSKSGMVPTDESLMSAYCAGEKEAFGELMRRYSRPLLGFLIRMTGNRQESEDHFQETFMRVHAKAETFDVQARFKPWLYTIATRVALDGRRKQQRRPMLLSLSAATGESERDFRSKDPREAAVSGERKIAVQQAILALPKRQRAALVLAYYQDLPYARIAEILECSEGTVKTHMSRALKKLATLLPEEQ